MVKRNVKKKIETKLDSFHNLDFKKKVLSVFLIVLAIGVIASVFPGEGVSGGAVTDTIKSTLKGVNGIITAIFEEFFGEENPLITYARVVLFILVAGLVFLIMKQFNEDHPIINLVVGAGVAYFTTFFIPMEALLATGILYSGAFLIGIILVPLLFLGWISVTLEKTQGGYILRSIIMIVMISLVSFARKIIGAETGKKAVLFGFPLDTILVIILIVLILDLAWSVIRIFTIKEGKAELDKSINAGKDLAKTIYTKIARKSLEKAAKEEEGGKTFSPGGKILRP